MDLKINKVKFNIFLEVAKSLNTSLDIIPILYGSLGLQRIIGEFGKSNDIDILVPKELTQKRWNKLVNFMNNLDFRLNNEKEHEFARNQELVAFGNQMDLVKYARVKPKDLKVTEMNGVKFKELSPEQYLFVYQRMLRDNYRQEKRGKNDKEKIKLIKKYYKKILK